MSLDATLSTWKLSNSQVTSTEKLFLLSCADRAGEEGICWPSISRLCADTCMDRKTIINVRQSCIEKGLLIYTGEMKGRTNLIPVMKLTYINHRFPDEELNSSDNGTIQNLNSTKNGTPNDPKNGTVKQYQKRDTESLINNLSKETTTTNKESEKVIHKNTNQKSKTVNSSSFIFSLVLDKEVIDQKLESDPRSNEEFLLVVKNHVENKSDKRFPLQQRIRGAIKLLAKLKLQRQLFNYQETEEEHQKEKQETPEERQFRYELERMNNFNRAGIRIIENNKDNGHGRLLYKTDCDKYFTNKVKKERQSQTNHILVC